LKTTTASLKRSIHQIGCNSLILPRQYLGSPDFPPERSAGAFNYSMLRNFSQPAHGVKPSSNGYNTSDLSKQLQACQNARDLSMFLRTNGRLFYGRQEFELLAQSIKVMSKTTRMTPAQVAGLMNALSRISTVAKSQQRQALLDLSHIAQPILKNCQVKELCIILNSLARKSVRNDKVFHPASQMLVVSSRKMNPQDLAIVANAFARVQHYSPKLFEVIAMQAISQIQDFSPQGLANLVNAFAKQNHRNAKLFEAVANESERRLVLLQPDTFTPQGLANIANAFGKMNHSSPKLFAAIAKAAVPCIQEFNPQNLSNMANAFARMNHDGDHQELFEALSGAALDKLSSFNAQELANLANAMVKMGHPADSMRLLPEIARAAMPLLSTFKAQELAMLTNALTKQTIELPDDMQKFWEAFAAAIIPLLPEFQPQELCIIANAFSKAPSSNGSYKMKVFDKIAAAALNLLLDENQQFQPQNLSNLANALAKVYLPAEDLFQVLMERAIPLLPQMSPQELGNLVSAVAKLRIEGPMVDRLFAETAVLLRDCNLASWEQRNLVEVAYAFLKAFQTDSMVLEKIGSELSSRQSLELDAVGLGHLAAVMSRTRIEASSELLKSIFASFENIPEDAIQISSVADVCKALPLAYEELGSSVLSDDGFLELMVEYSIRKSHDASPADVRDLLLNLTSPRLDYHHEDASSSIVELQRSLLIAYQPIFDQYSDQIATKHVKTIRRVYKRLHLAA